jgi:ankyrin repeat protein
VVDIIRDEVINGKVKPGDKDELATIFQDLDDYESFQLSLLHKTVLGITGISLATQLAASTANIDAPDSLGRTSLSAAAWRGDADAVETLLRHGARPNICTPTEISPLHRAIEGRNYRCVQLLVEHGAEVSHRNIRGRTPLHYSCRIEDGGEVCALLLRSGAEVDAADHGGARAIHEAVVHRKLPQLRLLLEHGAEVDCLTRSGDFPLKLAVTQNDVASATALLDAGADPRLDGDALLLTAASHADGHMLGFLAGRIWGMSDEVRDRDGNGWLALFRERQDEPTAAMAESLRQMCRPAEETDEPACKVGGGQEQVHSDMDVNHEM